MNVLIIGYVWPEPNSSAAGSRMMQLIETFQSQQWQITFATPAAESPHRVDLESLNIATAAIELNSSSFDHYITELSPDIVVFDRFMMEEQFAWRVEKFCPDAIRILDTEDLHFLRHARHQAVKKGRDVEDMALSDLNNEMAQREVAAIYRSDLTIMISSVESQLLIDSYGVSQNLLITLPFMLPSITDSEINALPDYEQRTGYISIGNFRHAPNWDAVRYLKEEIWPLIRQQQPDAELSIYGAYPPPKATQLDNPKQGFHVKGWAEDAKQVMSQSRVCLAPLRFGAGLKGKLVEAMQCGTPSVTTDIGAEGMLTNSEMNSDVLQWPGSISNSPQAFASSAIELYQDDSLWQKAQGRGHQVINKLYQKSKYQKALLNMISNIHSNLSEHRLHNFTGAMLRNHSMKSTQYMAQWIEAKNR